MSKTTVILDGTDASESIMVSPPILAIDKEPVLLWWREVRASNISTLMFQRLGSDSCELDRGIINEPALAVGADGQKLALWTKAGQNKKACIFNRLYNI